MRRFGVQSVFFFPLCPCAPEPSADVRLVTLLSDVSVNSYERTQMSDTRGILAQANEETTAAAIGRQ